MIGTVAFVLGFVAIGLTVLFLAFGTGPRGARGTLHRQGRTGRRIALVGVTAVTLLFGVGLPALVLIANNESQSAEAVGGVELTATQQRGRNLFARNCSTCHTLQAANGVGKVGPNLDKLRPPKALTLNAIQLGRARGQGQMPRALLDGKDAEAVADFVAIAAGR